MTKKITYEDLNSLLETLSAALSAAETHGLIVGMSSMYAPSQEAVWRKVLIEELDCGEPTVEAWEVFSVIRESTNEGLEELGFDFELLLPDDEESLDTRLESIAVWCRGYLSGLALIGLTSDDMKNATVKELITDLSQIAHVSIETDASEDAEGDYMQLVEYVRVAVQNIQIELQQDETHQAIH